ncbi:hypothetical protein HDU99_006421, partial [Rhizoclosmatium hyalinum]
PFDYPLVANCYHATPADVFVKIDVPAALWLDFDSLLDLSTYVRHKLGKTIGFSTLIVSDVIANAVNCKPVKGFIDAYEEVLSN